MLCGFPEKNLGILRAGKVDKQFRESPTRVAPQGGSGYRAASTKRPETLHVSTPMSINQELQDWTAFYAAVAGVAGVLVGLLFVALALSPAIMKDTSPPGLRIWCGETFHSLVAMLSFALLFLIPEPSGPGIGIPIVAISLLGLRQILVDIRSLRTDPDPRWSSRFAGLKQFSYMIAAEVGATVIGISLILGQGELIDWMVAPIFLLLINAAINCWDILKEIGNLPSS